MSKSSPANRDIQDIIYTQVAVIAVIVMTVIFQIFETFPCFYESINSSDILKYEFLTVFHN